MRSRTSLESFEAGKYLKLSGSVASCRPISSSSLRAVRQGLLGLVAAHSGTASRGLGDAHEASMLFRAPLKTFRARKY